MAGNELSDKKEKMEGRISIVREINEAKDTLFGPFCLERSIQMKVRMWSDILEKAKSLGLVAANRDYSYMRDIYWQNIKRHSLSKRENEHLHGKKLKRTTIDDLVYDIVDNTSSLHTQITNPTQDSVTTKTDHDHNSQVINESNSDGIDVIIEKVKEEEPFCIRKQLEQRTIQFEDPAFEEYELTAPEPSSVNRPHTNGPTETIQTNDGIKQKKEERKLKKRKAQREIDFLELQNYKTQLEVLDLEIKLGIEPSKYTKELAKRIKTNIIVSDNDADDDDEDEDDESDDDESDLSIQYE